MSRPAIAETFSTTFQRIQTFILICPGRILFFSCIGFFFPVSSPSTAQNMTKDATAHMVDQSPLSPCPESPNCVHQAHVFLLSPSELADYTEKALRTENPESIERDGADSNEMHAVYRVWFFKDDVHIAIQPLSDGQSVLFIRSASRQGYSDLGVNKRRVRKILQELNSLTGNRRLKDK